MKVHLNPNLVGKPHHFTSASLLVLVRSKLVQGSKEKVNTREKFIIDHYY